MQIVGIKTQNKTASGRTRGGVSQFSIRANELLIT